MARSGEAELRQAPQPQEVECPVPAQEVQLRYQGCRGCHRAMLAFQGMAQVARSALLRGAAAVWRRVEQSVRASSTGACFAPVPRLVALRPALAQPEGHLAAALSEAAGSAAWARL
jgi:hypothetical protein